MKTAIYCRLSEEDRNKQFETDDSNSIQNQKLMLSQYAQEQGWDVYRIYSDDDYTGSDRRRPAFQQLLKDAEAKKFDIVLCKTQSRFTRELELVEKYIHGLFPMWGIRFVSIVDNADTANKGNKKSRQINGLVNEWYLEDMSDNIRSVLTNRRVNGYHIGAFALYGYRKDPDQKGHLLIDEEAAAVVREVFSLFAQGYGKTAIARMLNDRGIPNPTEYKRQKGLRYKGPKSKNSTFWKYFAIADMLTNEIYIGNMVQGKYGSISYKTKQNKPRPRDQWYVVESTHEPIIDRELWDTVQLMLKAKAKPFSGGQIGLFAKKARCAYCGYILRSHKCHGMYYLECPNHHVAQDSCPGTFVSVKKVEQAVLDELHRLSDTYLDKDELLQKVEFQQDLKRQRERLQADLEAYQKRVEEYSKGLRSLYMDKVRGYLSDPDFAELAKGLSDDRSRAEKQIQELTKRLDLLDQQAIEGDHRKELIDRYTAFESLNRPIVETLIDYVRVGRRVPKTSDQLIEIHWNF